jgi:hypothetical protein
MAGGRHAVRNEFWQPPGGRMPSYYLTGLPFTLLLLLTPPVPGHAPWLVHV